MAVTLVFLGRLEDLAGGPERQVPVGALAAVIAGLEPNLAEAVSAPRIRVAVNGALVVAGKSLVLAEGDEVAFLPPVSGG